MKNPVDSRKTVRPSAIGRRLFSLRSKIGFSARETDVLTKLGHGTTRNIETGATKNPGVFTLISVAKTLGADAAYLIFGVPL